MHPQSHCTHPTHPVVRASTPTPACLTRAHVAGRQTGGRDRQTYDADPSVLYLFIDDITIIKCRHACIHQHKRVAAGVHDPRQRL